MSLEKISDDRKIKGIEILNVDDVILCDRMWTMHTLPETRACAYGKCFKCDGFNETCGDYDPMVLD